MSEFLTIMGQTALLNNIILLAFLLIFSIAFALESRNPKSHVNWLDLILDPKTKKVSVTKMGQLVGLGGSTWITVTLAMTPAAYSILPMIFPMWLAFIGGTYSYSQYIKGKLSDSGNIPSADPYQSTYNALPTGKPIPDPIIVPTDPTARFPDK